MHTFFIKAAAWYTPFVIFNVAQLVYFSRLAQPHTGKQIATGLFAAVFFLAGLAFVGGFWHQAGWLFALKTAGAAYGLTTLLLWKSSLFREKNLDLMRMIGYFICPAGAIMMFMALAGWA